MDVNTNHVEGSRVLFAMSTVQNLLEVLDVQFNIQPFGASVNHARIIDYWYNSMIPPLPYTQNNWEIVPWLKHGSDLSTVGGNRWEQDPLLRFQPWEGKILPGGKSFDALYVILPPETSWNPCSIRPWVTWAHYIGGQHLLSQFNHGNILYFRL